MKNILLLSLFLLLSAANLYAQKTDLKDESLTTEPAKINSVIIKENTQNLTVQSSFNAQIQAFDMKNVASEEAFRKRKNKVKRKSKFGLLFLNFAEHNFNIFTC